MEDVFKPLETVFTAFVPGEIVERMRPPASDDVPAVVAAWMISYTSEGALQNIRFLENGVRHCKLSFGVRVFLSTWTDAIVVSFVPLEALREPHVQEWFTTFYEVPVEQAKDQLARHPRFPYDGRDADTVRAQMLVDGSMQALLRRSRQKLRELGVPLVEKF